MLVFTVSLLVFGLASASCKSSRPAAAAGGIGSVRGRHGQRVGVRPWPGAAAPVSTRFEIGRSLADVHGRRPARWRGALPPDEESEGYDNGASAYSVSALHATELLDMGEAAAAAFLADGARA